MTRTQLILLSATVCVAVATEATAQQIPPTQTQQQAGQPQNTNGGIPENNNGGQAAELPPLPAGDPTVRVPTRPPTPLQTADEIAQRMYANGGSLMQAQLEVNSAFPQVADPGIAAPYSFFAVPEPEPTVIAKHDLITVVIREESTSKSSGKTDQKKDFGIDAVLQDYIKLSGLNLETRTANDRVSANFQRDYKGQGSYDRKDSFTTRLSAKVLDVKPNGNLVLQAERTIRTDDEVQTFRLIGTCRTADITADNTVLSTQLADLRLEKQTEGAVSAASKRGFIPRVIDAINPF